MSQINQLRDNPDNNVNIVNIINELYPNVKTKYIDLLIRLINNSVKNKKYNDLSQFQSIVLECIKNNIIGNNNIKNIEKFINFNERNLVMKNDLSTYKTFNDIVNEVVDVENKDEIKKLESEVIKLHENDDWLIIKPLSHKSSAKYGYETKWCTSMENDCSYFRVYSMEGIIIYCINKTKRGKKFAMYMNIKTKEISFWDSKDNRTDTMVANFPDVVLEILRKECNNIVLKSNHELFMERKNKPTKITSSENNNSKREVFYENLYAKARALLEQM